MRYVSKRPICAHRRPKPYRMTSSISWVVATPSFTSQSASPPHRLEKTIADEGVDLDPDVDRLHRHPVVGRHRCVDRALRGEVATDDLDDRHEVHRVVRMADNQPLRVGDRGLEIRGLDARGRRRNDGVGRTGRCDLLEDRHLDGRVFRNAFLDVDRFLDRLGDRADDTDTALGRVRQAEIDPGRSGVVEDLIDNATGSGFGSGS